LKLLRTLILAGILAVALAVAPAARADIRISPTGSQVFESEVGEPAAPQQFTISATCKILFDQCIGPDTVPVNVGIFHTERGYFSQTNNCPPTLTGSGMTGGESCTVTVGFTPSVPGLSVAYLTTGTGTSGPGFANLLGHGAIPKDLSGQAAGKSKKGRCAKRKRGKSKSAARKCKKKKKRA
jgi:hypothetical protein